MSFEQELVKEINSLRTNPKEYAKKVQKYISYFNGKLLDLPGSEASIETQEGAEAYTEAANFLSKQNGIEPFEPSKGLARVAKDYITEVQKISPEELEKIDLDKLIAKYGSFTGNLNRAIDFGGETPEQVIVNLLVSDGDPSREQRESLLSKDLKKVGVGFGKHEDFKFVTVIISSSKFKNNKDSDDSGFIGDEGSSGNVKETRSEKIVTKNGKRKKMIKITRVLPDGSKETETIYEDA